MALASRGIVRLLILAGAAASLQASALPQQAVTPDDYVELHRTRCYGTCPSYTVRVYGDGRVLWNGTDFVAVKGEAESHTDGFASRVLMEELVQQGFWSLADDYSKPVTDNPTYLTALSVGGHRKTVSDYAASAPAWLRDMDTRIDILADTHRWRHGDPAKERFIEEIPGPRPLVESRIEEDTWYPKPGFTELMKQAANSSESAGTAKVEALLRAGADVNAADTSGWTPLMYAGRLGTAAIFKALLAAGAKPDAVSKAGESVMNAVNSEHDYIDRAEKLAILQAALDR